MMVVIYNEPLFTSEGSSPEEDYPRRDSPPDNYFNGSYEKDIRGDSKTEFDVSGFRV